MADFPDFSPGRYEQMLNELIGSGGDHAVYGKQAAIIMHSLFLLRGQVKVSSEELSQSINGLTHQLVQASESADQSSKAMVRWAKALTIVTAVYAVAAIAQVAAILLAK